MEPSTTFWAGKRVCVTGGTGFLGSHIVRQLLSLRARVCVLALPGTEGTVLFPPGSVDMVLGDVRDSSAVRQAATGCEVIFHTAGTVAVWGPALARMHSVHVEGTRQVLEMAAKSGAGMVHTSSLVAVGGSRNGRAVTEDSPFEVGSLKVDYVHAKRAAEALALQATGRGQHVVVTNPGYLLGPDDHEPSIMGRFCARCWKGRIPLAPPGGLNLVDVRDVARGHLLAAEYGRPGRRYLLGGENRTFAEFLAMLAMVAGMKPRAFPTLPSWALTLLAALAHARARLTGKEPYPSFQHARLNRYRWFCRSDRAIGELGYHARPLAISLQDTYRWQSDRHAFHLRGWNRWWMRPGYDPARAA